ncbi:MAG: F0F1 ATP synthase subunit B [Bacteroidetes bacterium]|nr:F0F1 ATP synthase subunit B [Bacteroidota bacterium]MCH8523449.1 F0F1 ATP synthase subunit B [Balneolales bacterium]
MNFIIAAGLLDVDPGLFVWIFVTFLAFILIFSKFAWKPILGALNQREQSIKESIEAAEVAIKKAEQISKDNEVALREAEAAAQRIRKEAAAEAEAIRADRIEKTKEETAKMLEQARAIIRAEKKKALDDLRNEVAELAIKSAKIILDAEIDEKKNRKLVENFVNDLSKN